MRIAVISDVHANPAALQSALSDAESRGCGRVVCLGDLVGYGYDPDTCIDICRERDIECFLGNHDAGLISRLPLKWFNQFAVDGIRRHNPLVSDDNKKWLASLPYHKREGEYAFAHGVYMVKPVSISTHFDYVNGYSDAALQFNYMGLSGIRILFVGHTHCANAFRLDNSGEMHEYFIDTEDEQPIDLSGYHRYIVNVGSIGYPRNQPYSVYGIYDTETQVFRHRLLPFNFDGYIEEMKKSGATVPLWVESRKKQAEARQIGFR